MSTESTVQTLEIKRTQCRHIFTDGHRCGSPCLNKEYFCYFHHATRKPSARLQRTPAGTRELPIPEDRAALLLSIGHVIQGIATRTIDRKDASLLLYAFQVASSVLPRESHAVSRAQLGGHLREAPAAHTGPEDLAIVHDAVFDKEFGIIAPPPESDLLGAGHTETAQNKDLNPLPQQLSNQPNDSEERPREAVRESVTEPVDEVALREPKSIRLERDEAIRQLRYEHQEEIVAVRTQAVAETLEDLDNIVAITRARAIAETEARLRAEFNLPQPPTNNEEPTTIPIIQAVAGIETPDKERLRVPHVSILRHGCPSRQKDNSRQELRSGTHPPSPVSPLLCHSRWKSAFAGAPATSPSRPAIAAKYTPGEARKIEGHGHPNSRPVRHRALRRLHHSIKQIRNGIGPRRSRRPSRP